MAAKIVMPGPSFERTPHEGRVMRQIASRARNLELKYDGQPRKLVDWEMDIAATHANGCRLNLDALLAADDFNFAHDVFGICRHLDRDTGQLGGCFRPRLAARDEAVSQ